MAHTRADSPLYGWLENESAQYREARKELHKAERELRDQRERVAALRRALPLDTEIENYVFREGPDDLAQTGPFSEVRLSELVKADRPAVIYQFMYGGAQKKPCPMCRMWVDGFCGVARHLRETVEFAVVAAAPIDQFRSWAMKRNWQGLRLLSSAESSFKRDLHFEEPDGAQLPGLSVFSQNEKGELRHFYSVSAVMADREYRGIDLLTPVWNLLDLTREGREDWMPSLEYE